MKKKLICVIITAIMVLGMSMNVSAGFGRSYTAPKGTPVIDGEIDELWHSAEWTAVDRIQDTVQDTDSSLYIKLLWDESHLYFLANVYDSDENVRNDLVEIYIDQDKSSVAAYEADDHHTRFYVRKNGVMQNSGKNCQNNAVSFSKSIATNTFVIEGQLDWKGGTPTVGQEMGLEFMYNDGSTFQSFREAFRWNVDSNGGDTAAFESTEFFGTLILAATGTPNAANNTLPAKASKVTQNNNVTVNKNDKNNNNNASAGVDNSSGNGDASNNNAGNGDAANNSAGNGDVTNNDTNGATNDNQNNAGNDSTTVNGDKNDMKNDNKNNSDLLWMIIPLAAVIVSIAIVVVLVLYKKRKK